MYLSLMKSLLITSFLYPYLLFSLAYTENYSFKELENCPVISCTPYSIDLQNINFDTAVTLRLSDLSPNFNSDLEWCDQTFYVSVRDAQGQTLISAPDSVNLSCAFFSEATTFRISNLANGGDNYCWSSLSVTNAESVTCSGRFQDSLALVNFYRNSDGPSWPNPWDLSQPIDTWNGVQLNFEGRVLRLTVFDLPEPQGSPRFLPNFNLSELQDLFLVNSYLSGTIPDFKYLPKLEDLNLGGNLFAGNLPAFSSLPELEVLALEYNLLEGNIPDISGLPKLERLSLHQNNFTGGIPDFSSIPLLRILSLYGNPLGGPIPDFSNLPELQRLELQNNEAIGAIPNFSNLPALQYLDLSNNFLGGTLPDFSNIPALTYLSLQGLDLNGNIPDFTNLPNLEVLYLENISLSGTCPDFSNLAKLKGLSIINTSLSGAIPDFANLPVLSSLAIIGNKFTGCVPSLINSPLLRNISLNDNELDCLLTDFTYLTGLESLILEGNQFTHEDILPYYEDIQNHLINNGGFEGVFYPQDMVSFQSPLVGSFGETLIIDLGIDDAVSTNTYRWYRNEQLIQTIEGDNELVIEDFQVADAGTYHCVISNSELNHQTISTEHIIVYFGSVPNDACRTADSLALVQLYQATDGINWKNSWDLQQPLENWYGVFLNQNGCVECLDLDDSPDCTFSSRNGNGLKGPLPNINLPNLRFLFLGNNKLTGNLPDFSHFPNLLILWLSNNQLDGAIPDFSGLSSLSTIHLDNNNFSGTIPNFSNLSNLQELILAENELEGEIPDFSNTPSLNIVDFRNNQLTGSIPDFSNPNVIQYLYLENNQLSGSIPDFTNLPYLNGLYLGNNMLEGCLPAFSNTPNLRRVDAADNKLYCEIPDLTPLTELRQLHIDNNQLTFEDLVPNFNSIVNLISNNSGGASENFQYSPQEKFHPETLIESVAGESLTIDLVIDDAVNDNIYQWYKNGSLFQEVQGINKLNFTEIQSSDSGVYTCIVTNPNVPGLSLMSRKIYLWVQEAPLEACDDINLTFNQSFIPEGIHRAGNMIESAGTISENTSVTFIAGQQIRLLPGFQAGGNQVTFRAYIEDCEEVPEAAVKADLPEAPLISALRQPVQLSVFPNPVRSQVNLQYELTGVTEVSIYITDLNGKIVKQIAAQQAKEPGMYTNQVDLHDFTDGIYVVHLISNEGRLSQKLSVIK